MMGLAYIVFFAVYFFVSVFVIRWAIRHARKNGKNVWLWGGVSAFIMYNLVFWDWIPTVVAHKYYCSTEAGFWVYKTVDQWKDENPRAMEALVADKEPAFNRQGNIVSFVDTYELNQRLKRVVIKQRILFPLNLFRYEQEIVDKKNGDVLARYLDFSTGGNPAFIGYPGLKFWMNEGRCSVTKHQDSGSIPDMVKQILLR